MSKIKEEAISNYREGTGENQWFRTNCFFVFDKLKGVVEPENRQKSQPAGSWFKCLIKDHECIKGRFICLSQPNEILHKCTLEEIKEHAFKKRKEYNMKKQYVIATTRKKVTLI